jgi:hypothetical protein
VGQNMGGGLGRGMPAGMYGAGMNNGGMFNAGRGHNQQQRR